MNPDPSVSIKKSSMFHVGLKEGFTIAIGYVPIALTFGLLAKSTGLSLVEAVAMSLFVFAGAAQFMALNLIAIGTGAVEIVLATFVLNLRHLLLSATINEKSSDDPKRLKALYAFGITDETFSVAATSGRTITASYMAGLVTMAYSSWVVCSAAGYYAGAALPGALRESMGIALYAMFIGLLVPSMKKHRKVVVLAGTAALLSSFFTMFLSGGWAIVLATLVTSIGVELCWKGSERQ
ncbi:MAG TPA: AzlC family ABC transporter permease [Bacillales bacterium]|nr:AzlC family ABC transporter permease [Bacillales bacterium]